MNARLTSLSPSLIIVASCALATVGLMIALRLTVPHAGDDWQVAAALTVTPERAAEGFVDAYRRGAYARAASFATGQLARAVKQRARSQVAKLSPPSQPDSRRFVLQESQWLRHERLRLIGVLVNANEDESAGKTVALTMMKRDQRYYVEDVDWDERPVDQP
jgi:hypothetical protein